MVSSWVRSPFLLFVVFALGAGLVQGGEPSQPLAGVLEKLPRKFSADIVQQQILLDRAGISPGIIDGLEGGNTRKARHAFQQSQGLEPGSYDEATRSRLLSVAGEPLLRLYALKPDDVNGPFVKSVPDDFKAMSKMKRLAYRNAREALAEKFHMSEELLQALNRDKSFSRVGTVVTVPAVYALTTSDARSDDGGADSSRPTPPPSPGGPQVTLPARPDFERKAARVIVDKTEKAVRVYDAEERLLAFYPATIGSKARPAPSGTLTVEEIVREPNYTYDPKYNFPNVKLRKPVTVPPGPNGPAGLVWIGLSAEGYGIHGTAEPSRVGKSYSYGCIRLTNWDALALMKRIETGAKVEFIGGS